MLKGRGWILILLVSAFILTSCSSALDKEIDECREQFPPYAEQMTEIIEEWDDAFDIAASTSRIALSGPVGELQAIRREAGRVDPPVCVVDVHDYYLEGMDTFIGFFLGFMADPDSKSDELDISFASLQMRMVTAGVEKYKADPEVFFDEYRELAGTATAEAETE